MADFKYSAGIDVNLNVKGMNSQLKDLQKQLQQISNMKIDLGTSNLTADIEKASEAAMKLSAHLATATNPQTGNLDFTKFYTSIQKSGASLEEYGKALQNMGPAGQKAFVSLADSISKAEIPLKRTSKLVDGMWDNLKKTIGWQMSSSLVHGFIGSMQQAVGYAKDLNKSLTDIRIVTGASTDQMAQFAKEANKAAKNLSTTTTDYTRASLIYYQQGLSDQEVKARTETTIKMANATGTSAQKVSDQMTAIWNNFDNGTKSLTHYADVMTALGAATASSTDEIAEGLQKFAAISDTVGLSYEYAATALATITSTSRESADIVGNSLKTLFTRIQGLQLGETLDDGTTLNKYSTALAKVGISIKDSSGELKDMDLILDEMGNKWETLARDEQMALAQTVAGVRQYTQLMTLMENWDEFKQNLNIANTSGGTLDAQAAIYAESWEAASARVRTSWEGLWDNLINSNGFITALDTVSGLVGMLDGMITGLGGAGGALLTFGGALTKVFNKQITGTIQDAAYSISMMTKAGRAKVSNERSSFLSSAMEGLDRDNVSALGREYEYGARQDTIRQSLGLSYDYAKKGDKLSETQLLQYNMQKRALDELQQDSIKAASEYDQALKARSDLYWKIANNDEINSGLGSNSIDKLADLQQKKINNEYAISERRKQIKALGNSSEDKQKREQIEKEINNTLIPFGKKLKTQIGELEKGSKLTSDIISTGRDITTQATAVKDLQLKAERAQESADQILQKYNVEDAKEFLAKSSSENKELEQDQNNYRKQIAMQQMYQSGSDRINKNKLGEIDNYSKALINQAKASNQFKINMQEAFENNNIAALTAGLQEFDETASNSMRGNGFLQTLKDISKSLNDTEDADVKKAITEKFGNEFLGGLEKFMASSMNKISGAVYDQLSINDQAKFDSKEDFQQALRDAYSNVEITDANRRQKADQAKNLTEKMQQDLDKPYQESQSGTERLVKGAAAAMEALAAGESLKALWTSMADGTATLTTTLSGIASTVFNASSAITGFQSALTGLGGISAQTAGKIGLVITALTALVSTAMEIYDRATVSDKEHAQNLIDSSNELDNFTSTTKSHLETVKAQNEDYLEGVKKIKSFDQDPTTLAEDVFESNKKALNLITEYGLTEGQYSTGTNGLIEIKDSVLEQYGEQAAKQANTLSEYANVFGQARVDKEQAYASSNDRTQLLTTNRTESTKDNNWISNEQAAILDQYFEQPTHQGNGIKTYELTSEIINQMAKDGVWNDFIKTIPEVARANLEQMKSEYDLGVSDKAQADVLYDSSLSVLSNKILQDAGYNASNTDGYLAKSGMLSNLIEQQVNQQGDWLNTDSTAALTYEQQTEAAKLIGSQLGVSDIKITGVDEAGQIKYQQGNDESTASTITRESLNSLHAMSQVMKDTNNLVSQVNEKYQDQIDAYGKAGEVVANLATFDTALGASASAVKAFIEDTEDAQKAEIEQEDGSVKTAGEVFKDSGLSDEYSRILTEDDGIVKQLELGAEVLDNVSMSTLDSLQKVMDVDQSSMEGIKGLFDSITSIDDDPEKAAQLLTALSSMDFSGNAYLNASNLLNVLEDLGYNVNEGSLPAIYAWLAAITGLAPGSEDFADTNSKISKNRGALNGIEPGGTVNGEAKEAAEAAGLVGDWVKSGEDEYTYTGTQDQIDAAKAFQNEAWAGNQMAIDAAQAIYDDLSSSGIKDSYDSAYQLARDLGLAPQRGRDGSMAYRGIGNNNLSLIEEALGLESGAFRDLMNSDPQAAMDAIEKLMDNGSMSDETQASQAEDFMSNINSAQDMMNAINNSKENGDTAGFTENGLLSDATVERMKALTDTSEQYQGAMMNMARAQESFKDGADAYVEAEQKLAEAEKTLAETTPGTQEWIDAQWEKQRAEQEMKDNQDDYDAYTEAQSQSELALAIESVANARGLDADAVALQASQISGALQEAGVSAEAIAETAADMLIAQEGLDDLASSAKDFQSIMSKISSGKLVDTKDINNLNKMAKAFDKVAGTADLGVKQTTAWNKAFQKFLKDNPKALEEFTKGQGASIKKFQALQAQMKAQQDTGKDFLTNENDAVDQFGDKMAECSDAIDQMAIGEELGENFAGGAQAAQQLASSMGAAVADIANAGKGIDAATDLMSDATDFELVPVEASSSAEMEANYQDPYLVSMKQLPDGKWEVITAEKDGAKPSMDANGTYKFYKMVKKGGSGGKGGGGGGGGGGGAKEPKKVANKRKSQTVKRYKRNDAKRESASKSKDAAEKQKDYLYGESKIAQMEKINKLAQKEAKITSDRIEESRKYLEEDRNNLIKYMKKYGFEAEFEADGFLANYEEAWTAVYEEIAALYEDNLLTEEEEKIEEDLNVKLEELEGALEDYENSLKELADDIEKWEESMYEMFDNKIEQMEHKVEFKLELDEDSLTYIDFLIENLGDSAVRAIDKIDLIAEKTGYLFNSIQTAYEGVEEIYALSDDPLHLFATGGADIDGLLTESQVEALRGQADSLQDFADQLRDIRDTIQEQVAEVFDMWTEKVNHNISTLEHYGSVMEYFKGIIDLTGNDIFGLSDEFVRAMESAQINQSIDQMEANKAYYEELQEMRTNVEAELYKAQASGDAERIAYWEEHLRTVEEEMQTAQDSMLAALESTLSMITDQFTAAMEDAVEAFGKSLYASGGLEGLSNDYSLMREQADLMAEDYDKIYNLSKLTRNINKTLDDTNIIAGKQRLNKLLQEVNSLQADNVELSKFDLEYLQAKYELYLAEVELRNAQANKDTVTLTKDSEGNYSYVYTVNEDKVDEAQQKYEDALYEMQNMNHEYIEEMSAGVIETMQAMNDEIASLEISDFANLEEYNARVQEIREKYFAQLELQETELNKAINNNQELYETDWKAYSEMTGYKISADKEWINSFRETTLGYLTESKSLFSDFSQTASTYADTLVESLSTAATGYFAQIEEALAAYDTSIANFGSHITGTYKDIQDASDKTKDKTIEMAKAMKEAFEEVVNTVGNWQDTDGLEITEMLSEIASYLKEIFDAINTSANIKTDSGGSTIGQQEATRLLSSGFEYNGETYSFGSWTFNSRGDLDINDGNGFNKDGSNLVDYHAYLAEQVQDALDAYYSNPDDATLKATAENLIKRYWAYRSIIDRVYDPGEIESSVPKSFDTGGYTGEWGSEGRLAMLHQKEIVLNADDTANFLEALNISRQLIEMIEMNARASSLGLGEMVASTIKDNSQTIEQQVYITAEFPEATNHSEIEEAFDNIINLASQYAFRRD